MSGSRIKVCLLKNMLACICMLVSIFAGAQSKRANVWCMSGGISYNFNCSSPCSREDGFMKTSLSSANICDRNGNLQFYTDNETLWNSSQRMITNGNNLFSCRWSRQGAVIVPLTSNPYQYYVVSCDDLRYPVGTNAQFVCEDVNPVKYILSLSLVDMGANNGNGEVLWKNKVIYGSGHVNSMLAAVKHANTKDTWLLTYDFDIKRFVSLLLTDCGIQDTVISEDLGVKIDDSNSALTFSPRGDLVHVRTDYMLPELGNMVARFDHGTGEVYSPVFFRGITFKGCFSADSRYLYINGFFTGNGNYTYVTRYDLSITDTATIYANRKVIPLLEVSGANFGIQNGPDGKLYYLFNNPYLTWHLIDDPTEEQPSVSEVKISITKPIDLQSASPPNFVQSWFDPDFKEYVYGSPQIQYTRTCVSSPATFTATGLQPATPYHWEIEEKNKPVVKYYNTATVSHAFTKACIHSVRLVVDFSCIPDIITRNDIVVDSLPQQDYIKDAAVCTGDNYVLHAQPGQVQYLWNTGNTGSEQIGTAGNTYRVEVSNACGTAADTVYLKKAVYTLPNLITPNHDSFNDTFEVDSEDQLAGKLEIYNAWGANIYKNNAYKNTWPEGEVDTGIYYYRFTYSTCEPVNSWLQVMK